MSWHESQSNHNKNTCDFLHTENPRHIDWEVTTLFYSALHLVNNYFEKNNIALPETHNAREKLVKKELPSIHPHYRKLHSLSLRARYTVGHKMQDSDRQIATNNFSFLKTNIP